MGTSFHIANDLSRISDRKDTRYSSRAADRSRLLGALAFQALIAEVELTPKPGLVDRRGSGAHHDLSLDLMKLSATVLEPYFVAMSSASVGRGGDSRLRQELAAIGRDAEAMMCKATRGSNTHKGAIWNLGLLVSATSCSEGQTAGEIAALAGALARLPDRGQPALIPHVIDGGLSTLRKQREAKCSERICQLDALMCLMAEVNDSCVLYRGGREALSLVKSGARAVLRVGGYGNAHGRKLMRELDRQLIARHISPGGSADLLAATIFLDAVE